MDLYSAMGNQLGAGEFRCNVFRQFDVHRAGPLLVRQPKGLPYNRGDSVATDDLGGVFGDRAHHIDHVYDLEATLFAGFDRLLASDHQHGHGAQLCVGGGGYQVGGARPQRCQADAYLAGQAAVSRRHESRALLVSGQDQFDR
jgi:hypothetical protein